MHPMLIVAALAAALSIRPCAQATSGTRQVETEHPSSVLDIVRRAESRSSAGSWDEAAELWQRAVELDPVQPSYWSSLGRALYAERDYAGAIPAYERAAELGAPLMGPYYSVYEVARCQALLGENDEAIETLEHAFELGFPSLRQPAEDVDFRSLRDDPRFRDLLGLADVSRMSRDEGWRYDLSILAREVRRKGFNPRLAFQRAVTREQFDGKVKALDEAIPRLTDGQVVLRMMELLAFLGDGHSAVWDTGENALFRGALPLRLFWFEEGLFVTAADKAHADLLGARIEAFDGKGTEQVLEALRPYVSLDRENPMVARCGLPYRVRRLALLHAAGLIEKPDRVALTVRDLSGAVRTVTVEEDTKDTDIWNVLPAPASWVTFASTLPAQPLYVRHMDLAQWFEYLPEEKTVYFQFNKVLDGQKESLASFAARLFAFIDGNDVERLVIDMRWNNGGDTGLGQPLLLGLISNAKVNRRGRLFVIIGRRTFSAAQNMSTYFERFTQATFVGEPTGSCPNFIGEEVPVTLPWSKIMANVSHLMWQSSWPQDQRTWLAPQVYVPPTFADFRAGRDAALEAILELETR